MKIRTGVIVTIVTIIVVFASIVPLAMQVSLYPAVGDIEDAEAENAVLQVVRLIENDLKMLGARARTGGSGTIRISSSRGRKRATRKRT